MHARDDHYIVANKPVVYLVREASNQRATKVEVYRRESPGCVGDSIDRSPNSGQEVLPQAGAVLVIPVVGVLNLRRCHLPKDNAQCDPLLSLRITSAQGTPNGRPA